MFGRKGNAGSKARQRVTSQAPCFELSGSTGKIKHPVDDGLLIGLPSEGVALAEKRRVAFNCPALTSLPASSSFFVSFRVYSVHDGIVRNHPHYFMEKMSPAGQEQSVYRFRSRSWRILLYHTTNIVS